MAGLATSLAIFDLDGTLIDSKRDLVLSVNATRAYMEMPELSEQTISSYVGNGAPVLIQRAMGPEADEIMVARALEYFLGYYKIHKLDNTTLYPGVREALDRLLAEGIKLGVLTNKPVGASRGIIEGLGLTGHFQQIYGGNSFAEKKPNPIGIQTMLAETGAVAEAAVMVGDSHVDVATARNAGVAAAGVNFGFQPDTFYLAPPDFVCDDMRDLAEWILGGRVGG